MTPSLAPDTPHLSLDDLSLGPLLNLRAPMVEPENRRRGGWSSVVRVTLDGTPCFLKRQHQHRYRNVLLFPRPTLYREYHFMLRLHELGIGTADLLFYEDDGLDAVMLTRALDTHQDLNAFLTGTESVTSRQDVLDHLLQITTRMHGNRLVHGCLYGNHIMLSRQQPTFDFRLLDLEKMKKPLRWHAGVTRDLDQLFRHTPLLTKQECKLILDTYQQTFPWFKQAWTRRRPRAD